MLNEKEMRGKEIKKLLQQIDDVKFLNQIYAVVKKHSEIEQKKGGVL